MKGVVGGDIVELELKQFGRDMRDKDEELKGTQGQKWVIIYVYKIIYNYNYKTLPYTLFHLFFTTLFQGFVVYLVWAPVIFPW